MAARGLSAMGLYSERIFPWLLDRSLGHPRIAARRAALVAQARGAVLEIGFGSGATLPFYDPLKVTRLTVVEPSEGMNRRAAARLAESPVPVVSVPGQVSGCRSGQRTLTRLSPA